VIATIAEWIDAGACDPPSAAPSGGAARTGTAGACDGDRKRIERELAALADNAALQRLGYGEGLEAMTRELATLRAAVIRELATAADLELDAVLDVHAAIDRAIAVATRRYAEMREAQRDHFIAMLGHDLRDPLKAVQLTARTLGRHLQLREPASRIEAASTRMMALVGDVLDFARGHLGDGIPAHRESRDLGQLVQASVDELREMARGRGLNVELRGNLHGEVDRERFKQAVANLVSNAIHHGRGPIDIVVRETDDRHAIVTEVTSHGEPIPVRVVERMFDPFARLDPTGPREGLGLGLYIVSQIARAHAATCSVQSNADGTTFAIRWPRAGALEHAA
jgi:signal transduction histidine kinase